MQKDEILDIIKQIHINPIFSGYRMGLAGSYANGTSESHSDIDIVVSTDSLTIPQIDLIKSYFKGFDVDVLQLELLRQEDESLDSFSLSMNLPINNNSVYKTVSKEVIWV